MALVLRGCKKCGGDLYEQAYIGNERESICLQCGWHGAPRPAPPVARRPRPGEATGAALKKVS